MVSEIIEARKTGYDQLKEAKRNNDELILDIKAIESKKKSLEPEHKRIDEILGDLT